MGPGLVNPWPCVDVRDGTALGQEQEGRREGGQAPQSLRLLFPWGRKHRTADTPTASPLPPMHSILPDESRVAT